MSNKSKFILFNPSSPKPPKKVWDNYAEACRVAKWASSQADSKGQTYLVCEVRAVCIDEDLTDIKAYDAD